MCSNRNWKFPSTVYHTLGSHSLALHFESAAGKKQRKDPAIPLIAITIKLIPYIHIRSQARRKKELQATRPRLSPRFCPINLIKVNTSREGSSLPEL